MAASKEKLYCPECNRTKLATEFYSSKNKEKYPNGKLPVCKSCRTLMVNNWKKETFIDILEECDVPFVAKEWNDLLKKYGDPPEKCSGVSIIGRYLAKMQLVQYCDYRFKDSEKCQKKIDDDIEITMRGQGQGDDLIEQAKLDSRKLLPFPGLEEDTELPVYNPDGTVNNPAAIPDYFATEDDVSYDDDLTDEDKKYLRLTWGKTYNIDELLKLEKLYREMEESFDIQNAGHRDTLRKVCKTSLKTDQLLDIGDVDGAQKMSKMYEALMKAGKFTAVQNKAEQGECLDSVSELVLMCERQGFIPRYYVSTPKDKVDETIADMQGYVRDLFRGESNLEAMIEMAVKQIHEDESREEDEDIDEEEMNLENIDTIVKDEDFASYNEFLESEEEMSEEAIANFLKGGEN